MEKFLVLTYVARCFQFSHSSTTGSKKVIKEQHSGYHKIYVI